MNWEAPGPGEWTRLADHFDKPFTAEYERIFAATFEPGMAAYSETVGLPVRTVTLRTVHGYPFLHPAPLSGPDVSRTPPAALVWLLSRVASPYRKRNKIAAHALEARLWRDTARRYFETERPAAIAENEALTAIDPAALADADLADHLQACETLAIDGYRRHFELHSTDMFPVGLYLAECRRLGIDVAIALDLVVDGISDVRAGLETTPGFEQCIVGGYDLDRPRLVECTNATASMRRVAALAAPSFAQRHARFDELVPDERREQFDILLADARAVHPVRDDNGLVLGAWRIGLLRRAYLEAGARLGTPLVIEATVPELVGAIARDVPLDHAELSARVAERETFGAANVPLRLGPAMNIPIHAFPAPLGTVMEAQLLLRDLSERVAASDLEGTGVGTQSATGIARVVTDAEDAIDRIEEGDILVASVTSPAFNAVLPLAAALVVEHGGLMSHAALVARELGIPAIVGVHNATRNVHDGERIQVDAAAGRVVLLDVRRSVEAIPGNG
jgi:phosphohistidine swiveling domain-containing protein